MTAQISKSEENKDSLGYCAAQNPAAAFRPATRRASSTPSWLSSGLATDFERLATPSFLAMSSLIKLASQFLNPAL